MLIETKAITELGLVFGNSWQVIGIVIVAILLMAMLANWAVLRYRLQHSTTAYLLLLISLAIGWVLARTGALPSTGFGRITLALAVTSPVFFSGIAFSTLLARFGGSISSSLALNLLGAMCGGLLEYNSMYFGFRFLYLLAAALYLAAFLSQYVGTHLRLHTQTS
jgi:hypothetical protein